jgi:hypothetical protein
MLGYTGFACLNMYCSQLCPAIDVILVRHQHAISQPGLLMRFIDALCLQQNGIIGLDVLLVP